MQFKSIMNEMRKALEAVKIKTFMLEGDTRRRANALDGFEKQEKSDRSVGQGDGCELLAPRVLESGRSGNSGVQISVARCQSLVSLCCRGCTLEIESRISTSLEEAPKGELTFPIIEKSQSTNQAFLKRFSNATTYCQSAGWTMRL